MLIRAFFNRVFSSFRLLLSNFSSANPIPSGKNREVSSFLTALKKYASFLFVVLSQTPNDTEIKARQRRERIDQVRSFPKLNAKAMAKRITPVSYTHLRAHE